MNSLTSNKYGFQQETVTLFGRVIGAGNYLVKAGFGTPKRDFNLIFDTGSEYTWLRCEVSKGYKPSASSTSTNATCISGPPCTFNVNYGDGSSASGYFIRDWLTLTPVDVFHNFTFGCGLQISPDDFGSADGILGVEQYSPLSFVSQTYTNFAKIFCYCLPKSDSSTGINIPSKTIMDSGTVITRLPSPVYSVLLFEFMKFMSKYPRAKPRPEQDHKPLLDACYNLEGYGIWQCDITQIGTTICRNQS
ncbi:hypothetical protein QYF36_009634 [Acer negundo]|nr:hypothetical protein QYF36_009634 [Acer negundo]